MGQQYAKGRLEVSHLSKDWAADGIYDIDEATDDEGEGGEPSLHRHTAPSKRTRRRSVPLMKTTSSIKTFTPPTRRATRSKPPTRSPGAAKMKAGGKAATLTRTSGPGKRRLHPLREL
eukprot:TRINITY_DN6859_c0_g1_i2.p2 TRINITY_DN6859_c0_g1~~TRINITY_DN6859_c0_g1_i2.p2  ORF type:complete len:118 (+),score=13.00 TRINITY_DN6859_c0_g1_i2:128-481(+)